MQNLCSFMHSTAQEQNRAHTLVLDLGAVTDSSCAGAGAIPARAYPQQAPSPEASYASGGVPQQASASHNQQHFGTGMAAGGAAAGAVAAAGAGAGGYTTQQGSNMVAQSSGQDNKDWVRLDPSRPLLAVPWLSMLLHDPTCTEIDRLVFTCPQRGW